MTPNEPVAFVVSLIWEDLARRLLGSPVQENQRWAGDGRSLLLFNALLFLAVFAVLLLQGLLPLNPDRKTAMEPSLAFNTAASFTSNTNLQHYSGEASLSDLSQLSLMWLQFVSAATGIAALAFYALNVERKGTNPQSEIANSAHVRIYYFKVEAGTISRPDATDGNTPGRISDSQDVRVYCMYGVVRKLGERPMLEVVNSRDVAVSQLKTLSPGDYPHLVETFGPDKFAISSSKIVGLFAREAER